MERRIRQRLEIFKEVEKSFRMGRDELKEYQLKKLKSTLLHVFDNCNYYKDKMKMAGINRPMLENIKSLDDIKNIPFTSREDISAQYPFGLLSVPENGLSRYGKVQVLLLARLIHVIHMRTGLRITVLLHIIFPVL